MSIDETPNAGSRPPASYADNRKVTFITDFEEFLPSKKKNKNQDRNGDGEELLSIPIKNTGRLGLGKSMVSDSTLAEEELNPTLLKKVASPDGGRGARDLTRKARIWGTGYWRDSLFWTVLALGVMFVFGSGSWAFPDDSPACLDKAQQVHTIVLLRNGTLASNSTDTSDDPTTAVNSYASAMCELKESLENGVLSLTLLSAFIIGGFVMASVNIWLARRSSYLALCGATRNLLININSIIPQEADRRLMSRWTILAFELSVLKAREIMDSSEGCKYLMDLNLLHSNEWDAMVDGDRHTTVWFWIQIKAEKLAKERSIDRFAFQTLCNAVTLSRNNSAHDLMRRIGRDHPPPYVFVCALLININLLFHSVTTGIKWAIWLHNSRGQLWEGPKMYVEILVLFAYTTIYAMLFDVSTLLCNPFGPRDIDINHRDIAKGMRKLAKSLASLRCLPDTMNEGDIGEDTNFVIEPPDSIVAGLVRQEGRSALMSLSIIKKSTRTIGKFAKNV